VAVCWSRFGCALYGFFPGNWSGFYFTVHELDYASEAIYDNKLIYWVYNLLGFTNINSFIFFLGFFMLGIIVVGNLVSTLAVWVQLRFAWRKHHNISTSLLKKYLSLPYVYFLDHHSADLSKNILTETLELTQILLFQC
jgi:ABC-type multidrug transport system fused ATPase/permease subunit